MSCNGCRVLRKGCSEICVLRSCLHWIPTPEAQGHATLFLAKFFGRSDLLSLISTIPESQRPALFQSLLFEACGRTVNPVGGAVGLLSSGNWHVCQAAVDTVLNGGASTLRPLPEAMNGSLTGDNSNFDGTSDTLSTTYTCRGQSLRNQYQCMSPSVQVDVNIPPYDPNLINLTAKKRRGKRSHMTASFGSDMSEVINVGSEISGFNYHNQGGHEIKLLDLFV